MTIVVRYVRRIIFLNNKLITYLTILNTLAIAFLLYNAYMNYEGITHMWDMFQDFERLLIEILTNRLPQDQA